MKAVLCLWAREHLKGRLGPGSGLARLLEKKRQKNKKNPQHSPLCMWVCVFGKDRQNRTAVLGYSWQRHSEEQAELLMLRREEGWRNGFTNAEACWFPLTCCPVADGPGQPRQSEGQRHHRGAWRSRCRGGDETSLQGSLCWRITRGRKRILAHCFHPLCFCSSASEWSTWLLKDTQHLPAWICWIITWGAPGQAAVMDYWRLEHLE